MSRVFEISVSQKIEKGVNSFLQRNGSTVSKISCNYITHDENSSDRDFTSNVVFLP